MPRRTDLLAVTETWFTDAAGDHDARSICPRGCCALQKPRDLVQEKKRSGGGLALFYKNSTKAIVLNELPDFIILFPPRIDVYGFICTSDHW
ncbi:hypothetical protein DAPPUDRAFT_271594 [Daphnia pulex]|uniref:Uncharacterized protein n=1 Tax=Daphnia pulex TaxID=6669 RepID=E9I2A1_DAPPU|nr:hypothetical protein DAPPUDRAFT_271594 [Daphnia pulex]|eukprot:EFX61879.1 hypothetical protein DAPPUDRAFT_271594 [Daphnia pulex]